MVLLNFKEDKVVFELLPDGNTSECDIVPQQPLCEVGIC